MDHEEAPLEQVKDPNTFPEGEDRSLDVLFGILRATVYNKVMGREGEINESF